MSKYLREIDLLVSGYGDQSILFRKEMGCLAYMLSAAEDKKITSAFAKAVVQLLPAELCGINCKKWLGSSVVNVLSIDFPYGMEDYFKITALEKRHGEVINIARGLISKIPDDIVLDKKEVLALFDRIEESNYRIYKEYGRWISNSKKTQAVKIFAEYAMHEMVLGIVVKDSASDELVRHPLITYDTFNSFHMDKIGKVEFIADDTIKYTPGIMYIPKYVHEPIVFKLP